MTTPQSTTAHSAVPTVAVSHWQETTPATSLHAQAGQSLLVGPSIDFDADDEEEDFYEEIDEDEDHEATEAPDLPEEEPEDGRGQGGPGAIGTVLHGPTGQGSSNPKPSEPNASSKPKPRPATLPK